MKRILITLFPLSLCSCAQYPNLLSISPDPNKSDIKIVLDAAENLQRDYATGYRTSAKLADYSQIPVIGAAAGAAWVLLVNKTDATMNAAKIGIGAGAYTASRGQLISSSLPDLYIAGHGALTCVIAEGSYFDGDTAANKFQSASAVTVRLEDAIMQLESAVAADPSGSINPQDAQTLSTAKLAAKSVLQQARTADSTALSELASFTGAAPVFRNAVSAVSVKVASKGRVRPAVDYATLRDALSNTPTSGEAPASAYLSKSINLTQFAPNTASATLLAQDILNKTALVLQNVALTTSGVPHYRDSLLRVAGCPDQIR